MNKKLAAALSGGAAIVLTLTGCSDDDDKGAERDDWAKTVCDEVKPQVDKIQQANTSIDEVSEQRESPEKVQKTYSTAFQDVSEAYKTLANAVKKAGTPPVDDGKKLGDDAVKELNALSRKYGELKKSVDKMNTGDQGKFADDLEGLASTLEGLGKSGNRSLQKLEVGELGEAMAEQEGCQRPSPGATPSA